VRRLLAERTGHPVSLSQNSPPNGLDDSPQLSLHVSPAVNTNREPQRS
jgi:hypothetical protein